MHPRDNYSAGPLSREERNRHEWMQRRAEKGKDMDRTCPTCDKERLTAFQAAQGYQCDVCTKRSQGFEVPE